MAGNALVSPRFVRAKTEEELQRKLLKLQLAMGKKYNYITIYPDKEGVVAWYYEKDDMLKQLIKGSS